MNDIERLLAIEEISTLKARYCRFVDTKDWRAFEELFAPDAQFFVSWSGDGDDSNIVSSSSAIAEFIRDHIGSMVTVHHCHMAEIELVSPATASGIWAMEDFVQWPDGGSCTSMHGFGHYHETYQKVDGRWRISTLRLTRLRMDFDTTTG